MVTGDPDRFAGVPQVSARPAGDLAGLLGWLRSGRPAPDRLDFTVGTALPDGRLDLCKQALGPAGARAVAGALPPQGPVRHLLMGTDGLGDEGADAAAAGAVDAGLPTLYLGCNLITATGAGRVVDRLAVAPVPVRGLWLKRNPLRGDGVRAVAALAGGDRAPATLDLAQTGMDAAALAALVTAVTSAGRVRRLFLSGNPLGPQAADQLGELVATGRISQLYVSAAGLGDAGATALTAGLRRVARERPVGPEGLRHLAVGSNGIGPDALQHLIEAAVQAGVQVLELGRVPAARALAAADNQLGATGTAAVGQLLAAGPHRLAELGLQGCGIGSRGALALLDAVARASCATRIQVGGGVADRIGRDLREAAAHVPPVPVHPEIAAIRSVHRGRAHSPVPTG